MLDGGGDDVGLAGGAGDEEVEVAYGFAAAAQGAGGSDLVDAGEVADEVGDAFGVVAGLIDAEAAGVGAVVLDALEELGDELFAHAGELGEVAGFGGGFELCRCRRPGRADQTRATVLGPMPGRRRSSSMVGLYLWRSSSRRGMVPVETRATMLAAMPLPMPGMARRALGSASGCGERC